MIPAYTCPAIADAPTLCIPKEKLLQINSLTRKQRDSKSPHKKKTLQCISICSGTWAALLKAHKQLIKSKSTMETKH
jgi:hypothetical protein